MDNRKILLSLALLGGVASTSIAHAETGWYVLGGVNSTTVDQFNSRNTGTSDPNQGPVGGPSISVTDSDTGVSAFIAGGYQYDFSPDFYGAVEVFYSDEQAETQTFNSVKITDIELDASYGIDFKFGHNVTDRLAIYGLLGVTQFDFDGQASYTFAPPVDDLSDEEVAFVYGGGLEISFNDHWSTIAEFRLSNDVEFDTPVDRGGVQSEDEFDFAVIRTGLKYRF